MRKLAVVVLMIWFMIACSPVSKKALHKTFVETEARFQDYTGFMLYDLKERKSVFEYNASKYFTPASNTKIFTLFASLKILGDSIPALRYQLQNDSLIFWGTGDPSLLYKDVFQNDRALSFLRDSNVPLYFSSNNFKTTHFGTGWAWDDYYDYYSAERSPLPVYGNLISVDVNPTAATVTPRYYKQFMTYETGAGARPVVRNLDSNMITIYRPVTAYKADIPARINDDVTVQLLADTLKRSVRVVKNVLRSNAKTVYGVPADSLYKVMMQASDNFIAEQLLTMCAGVMSDTLKPEIAIDYVTRHYLNDFVDPPVWVDGSGLSRYNLFTPRSIVQLWEKLYTLVPEDRLFAMLAVGGKAGTIRNWYKADKPYVFGKTGSLSNNHCLSGYLITKSGKKLIFSFMNSNFTGSSADVRKNMQTILKLIYEKY